MAVGYLYLVGVEGKRFEIDVLENSLHLCKVRVGNTGCINESICHEIGVVDYSYKSEVSSKCPDFSPFLIFLLKDHMRAYMGQ